MKSKAILLGAILATAITTTRAQSTPVYSVNVVGYHKQTLPPGFTMIANQVQSTNNTLNDLIKGVPNFTSVYKYNGTGFDISTFSAAAQQWSLNLTLNPGDGAFIFNPTGTNISFIFSGDVLQGSLTNPIPAGYSMRSSIVPQNLDLNTLNFPAANFDTVYLFNGSTYSIHTYNSAAQAWSGGTPTPKVGESFWVLKQNSANWVRNFSAN